ncbi:transposase, IS605 OrfB family [Thermotoga petrophila RKU-1]|uniref:Transposase, IS605 OrfB family n=1 Tax=Thermotoga petrophila (strain ATCC BAA-488 / DSM 13995 / JCM 10881 / RKU-1) TaxID=390874 RepID=A5ILQ6_THEP1|nr:RNA-guided endonuclease TnpB family protein [Thermotoga petrophila]ABQ47129.1 transposase, IS605 OrfB family [Thermotoga petrophila RKU-1]
MPGRVIRTYKLAVPGHLNRMCEELNRTAARIYNKTMSLVRKIHQKKGFWLSWPAADKYILRWAENIKIHVHSKQAFVQLYFQALKGYFKAAKKNQDAKPPHKKKRYLPFIWKESAVKLLPDGTLRLSLGKEREPFVVQTPLKPPLRIKQARLVFEDGYYLHLAIEVEIEEKNAGSGVMAADLGVLRPITCFDGKEVISYHGGVLSSTLRYRNKRLASFQSAIAECKKGSRRYNKLVSAKKRALRRLRNQINDIMHKITSSFIGLCLRKQIRTIVIGDVTGIRERADYSDNANQKIHQWQFRKLIEMIRYKAEQFGIEVKLISEANTSKTCPNCGAKNNPNGRRYHCKACGFEYHRDGVGAINIWKRYPGTGQVVAGLAPVRGVRFHPHLCGHGASLAPWKVA